MIEPALSFLGELFAQLFAEGARGRRARKAALGVLGVVAVLGLAWALARFGVF